MKYTLCLFFLGFFAITSSHAAPLLALEKDSRIVLIGNVLGSRMMQFGSFETNLQLQNPIRGVSL